MKSSPKKKIPNELSLPEDYSPPDVEDGGEFEAVVTIRRKGDKYCAIKLDGEDMPGYEEVDEPDEPPKGMGKAAKMAFSGEAA